MVKNRTKVVVRLSIVVFDVGEVAFNKRYKNVRSIRFFLSSYIDLGWMKNVPLYAVGAIASLAI